MMREKAEPWQRDDVQTFLRLLEGNIESERAVPFSLSGFTPPSALLSPTSKEERIKSRIENAWRAIRAHSIYRWLEEQPAFSKSWKLFHRTKARAKPGSKISASDAPFIFLHIIVEWAPILHDVKELTPKITMKRGPTASRRKLAIKAAETIIQLSDEGLYLSGLDGVQLRKLLIKFIREVQSIKRKRRADKNSTVREVLEHAAYQLLTKLDLTYPSILANLAALANVECPTKNAQRYFVVARRRYRSLLVKGPMAPNVASDT
jgi:hypothetical protein